MKMWIVIIIGIVIIAVISFGGILLSLSGRHEVQKLTIDFVNFGKLDDGIYIGEYTGIKSHSRDTRLQVTIYEGKISDIKILKGALDKEGNPTELTGGLNIDDLFENVIKSQSLQVDVISGATLTSKTHLKALENALEKAQTNN
jgi:uncharacterized protein with FMN-binding domain